jgi:hypothetical protein
MTEYFSSIPELQKFLHVWMALVQRSATGHHLVFDGPLIWSLPSWLGNELISGVRRRAFG